MESDPGTRSRRATGIEPVGDAPWGTHFCQFYESKEDLTEILIPYFAAGLRADEQCIWVTSPPLEVEEAWAALARAMPDLEEYRRLGRIEILPYTEWYLAGGSFDQGRVLAGWVEKLEHALRRGCAGLRLTGNTFWLEKPDWRSFAEYEAAVDAVIDGRPVLALCTYSLERCGASEVADVIKNHQFALIKREGTWELIESFDRRRMREAHAREIALETRRSEDALRASEERYRLLFSNLSEGFAVHEMLYDEAGRPRDYRFLEVNPAFERLTGLAAEQVVGRTLLEVLPDSDRFWIEQYGEVVASGVAVRFDHDAPMLGRHYEVIAFRPTPGRFATLFFDVTERKQAERDLREADRRKNEFLAVLSHELRNPLAPIRNGLFVLERTPSGSEQSKRALSIVERQVRYLSSLVDDLLDVTRIARGKVQIQRQTLELGELARRAVEDHRDEFATKGVELSAEIPSTPTWLEADETRIAQIAGNLLQNAAKFTPQGGRVQLAVRRSADAALLSVRDSGVGIAPEVLAGLFEPFAQAEQTLDRSRGGLGLGLALVKGLVELHGGTVCARSEGIGRGAEFTIRLPLAQPPERPGPAASPRSGRRRRVLVIEDSVDAADSVKEALQLMGHQVSVAYDGVSGLLVARQLRPEFVLCDIGLPQIDGCDVARAFQADPDLRDAVLIALTGYAQPEDRKRTEAAGFSHHLAKPPDLQLLQQLLA